MFGVTTNGLCVLLFVVLVALILLTGGLLLRCLRGPQSQISMTDIKLSTDTFQIVMPMGATGHEKLTITNEGESAFDWQMTWDAAWLNAEPAAGTITPSISETIQLDFDAMSLAPGIYTTTLILTGDLVEVVEMPIRLEVSWHETYLPFVTDERPFDYGSSE